MICRSTFSLNAAEILSSCARDSSTVLQLHLFWPRCRLRCAPCVRLSRRQAVAGLLPMRAKELLALTGGEACLLRTSTVPGRSKPVSCLGFEQLEGIDVVTRASGSAP